MAPSTQLAQAIHFFEHISLADCARMEAIYTADAAFKDPFNDVQGSEKIAAIFAEMFTTLHDPRFRVLSTVEQGEIAFITWDFTFRIKSYKPDTQQTIHGASQLRFAADGRIANHRDYWDAADELYAKLPLVGALMRVLKKKFANH
jgi:steroid Delta-isomerase